MWTITLIRWMAEIAGGLSFGLAAVVLLLFARLRKMGRSRRLPYHIIRMAVAHLGLILFGCVWIGLRLDEGHPKLLIGTPFLLFIFVVSDAGLIGLLWDEYLRTVEPKNTLTREELMELKKEADATHADHEARLAALEKREG